MSSVTESTPRTVPVSHDDAHGHGVPLWGLFLALILLTAAEVALFETWSRNETFNQALPKFVLVLLILAFTIPKALIVLVYFMHLKFERLLVVLVATVPFILVGVCIFPTLVDIRTLSANRMTYNQDEDLGEYILKHGGHDEGEEGQDHAASLGDGHETAGFGGDAGFGGGDGFGDDAGFDDDGGDGFGAPDDSFGGDGGFGADDGFGEMGGDFNPDADLEQEPDNANPADDEDAFAPADSGFDDDSGFGDSGF